MISARIVSGVRRLGIPFLLFLASMAAPMKASAQLSVAESGMPGYSMTISVPPGIAGMAPNLGLLYGSSGVNGPLGLGWTVQGISAITRCPGNIITDGYVRSINYDFNDKLCLDGQRLIQTDPDGTVLNQNNYSPSRQHEFQVVDTYGGQEYRTERDMFARIRSYGGDDTSGPAYFKVWTKSGQVYEYGVNSNATANAKITSASGQVVVAWPVSRISDTLGNYIDFQYEQRNVAWGSGTVGGMPMAGHEWNLKEVRYTGSVGKVPTSRVVFDYSDRPDNPIGAQDRAEAYHLGMKNVSVRRLDTVRTFINWPADQINQPASAVKVKTIKLGYEIGPTSGRSRLGTIVECAGAAETQCLPATKFTYSSGGGANFISHSAFQSSPMSTLPMVGAYGVLTGNFFGSGRTDILRWGVDSNDTVMYKNVGNGTFTAIARDSTALGINLYEQSLFSSDGCYNSIAADFNGDGLTDVLRVMQPTKALQNESCGAVKNYLFISQGNGSFLATDVSQIDFTQTTARKHDFYDCPDGSDPQFCPHNSDFYLGSSQTLGQNYHLLDVNNDGVLDVITTISPEYPLSASTPSDESLCAYMTCTHVYLGSRVNGFVETSDTNLTHRSVYAAPPTRKVLLGQHPYVGDLNGDALADLFVDSGRWISRGDGNFTLDLNSDRAPSCQYAIDFNGDGRADCLYTSAPGDEYKQALWFGDGKTLQQAGNFNLTVPGTALLGTYSSPQTMDIAIADIDGDGRADILRWADNPGTNAVFLSNGDGTFRNANFNLITSSQQLQKSDGSTTFVLGDFTGRGNTEILRMVANPDGSSAAARNILYIKSDPTPPDQLQSVLSNTGLRSSLSWSSLSAVSGLPNARYSNARYAYYPSVDLTIPMYVVTTLSEDSGNGNTLNTEFAYAELRSSYDRGWLGFGETKRQTNSPNGSYLTVTTRNHQTGSYVGMAKLTETRAGSLQASTAPLLSRSSFIYCDKTAAPGTESSASIDSPCLTIDRVQRPYLYQSVEEGFDLNGNALPTVTTTNSFNDSGDPTRISVATTGMALGFSQTFTKVSNNTYLPNNTAGDSWILGRLSSATVTNTVPNMSAVMPVAAGSAPLATAIKGNMPVLTLSACTAPAASTTPTAATRSCTVSNTGTASAASISYAPIGGSTVSGPTGTCAAGATCGTVTVSSGTTAGTYAGTLIATPNTGVAASLPISLTVNASALTPAALALACSGGAATTTPTAAVRTCTLTNSGQTGVTSIAYSTIVGATVSGPTGACAGGASCGSVTITSGTAAGTYSGTLTATPNAGTAATTAISLTVNASAAVPSLALSCSGSAATTTPTAAVLTCTLSNSGAASTASITYSTISGATVAGPSGACAAGANCGTVTVTSGTAAGTYSGTLTATPNAGTGASNPVSLTVNAAASAPALTFSCSGGTATTTPTPATRSCTVTNSGTAGATSIAYSSIGGATVSGPTGACAAGATCGTVTVTSGAAAGTYSGTLTATPNTGSAASTSISLTVNPSGPTPPALALSCSGGATTTSPTAAVRSCTVTNTGQTGATSISYSAIAGTTIAGPTGSCAAGATCGTVTVTSGTAPATYSGTLSATPNTGSAASTSISLTVNPAGPTPPALALSCSGGAATTSPTAAVRSCTVTNTGQTGATSISYSAIAGTTIAGPTGSCAAGATCGTATVTSGTAPGTYSGTLTATPNTGSAASTSVNLTVNPTSAKLVLSCPASSVTTAPTAASIACTLSNTGQSGTSDVTYYFSSLNAVTVSGPTGPCAAGATCGTVTLTSATAVGDYSGLLVATPNLGSTASASLTLKVNASPTPPALALSCSGGAATTSPTAAVRSCTVTNTGQTGATSISYSAIAGTTIAGPTGSCAAGATCGTVTVTSGTAPATYSGTLSATPNTGSAASTSISLTVNPAGPTPPALALSCSGGAATTSPTAAVRSCTVTNTGQTGATSISYSAIAGTTIAGPTGSCAAGATCGTATVTSGTAPGTYSGTLTATPNTGSAASTSVNLTVNPTSAKLVLSCPASSVTTAPTAASIACTLSNTGQSGTSDVTYYFSSLNAVTVSGPTGPCAAGATCGTVTLTSATAVGDYSGLLVATPNLGSTASVSLTLKVNASSLTPPALALSCSGGAATTSPTAATRSCTVTNTGQTGASSIAYSSIAGASVVGPTGSCAAGATCGTVTVTSGTAPATYSGTLTATPNTGSAASSAISLTVNPSPPSLALACSGGTPSTEPSAASMSCTVSNTGQTALASISYSTIVGAIVSGPSGACAPGAVCGTVTITSGTTAGSYAGTLTATPNIGSAASTAVNLTVNALATSTTIVHSPATFNFYTVGQGDGAEMTFTITNSGTITATDFSHFVGTTSGINSGEFSEFDSTCGNTLAPGASCTVTVNYYAFCTGGLVRGRLTSSGTNFPLVATSLTATTSSVAACN
ncbi:MAG: FG-GAP-like repeat-containing protein [Pseudomonadota bacterium]